MIQHFFPMQSFRSSRYYTRVKYYNGIFFKNFRNISHKIKLCQLILFWMCCLFWRFKNSVTFLQKTFYLESTLTQFSGSSNITLLFPSSSQPSLHCLFKFSRNFRSITITRKLIRYRVFKRLRAKIHEPFFSARYINIKLHETRWYNCRIGKQQQNFPSSFSLVLQTTIIFKIARWKTGNTYNNARIIETSVN